MLHTANGDGVSEKLLVFGGWSGRKYAEPELRELHIGSDWAWRRVLSGGQPPLARAYHTATRLADEKVLVFGGHDADLRTFTKPSLLELSSMAWHHPEAVSGTPPAPRTGHAAVCLDGVRVLVHGGWEPLPAEQVRALPIPPRISAVSAHLRTSPQSSAELRRAPQISQYLHMHPFP